MSGGPNFAFELCLRRIADEDMEGLSLESWRFAFNAAEPVSPDTIVEFEKRFARWGLRKNCLSPSYGLAESSVGVAITVPGTPWRADRLDRERFTRTGQAVEAKPQDPSPLVVIGCGTPIPGHAIRVVDAAGLELPDRQEGLLQFRGPSSTSGSAARAACAARQSFTSFRSRAPGSPARWRPASAARSPIRPG